MHTPYMFYVTSTICTIYLWMQVQSQNLYSLLNYITFIYIIISPLFNNLHNISLEIDLDQNTIDHIIEGI